MLTSCQIPPWAPPTGGLEHTEQKARVPALFPACLLGKRIVPSARLAQTADTPFPIEALDRGGRCDNAIEAVREKSGGRRRAGGEAAGVGLVVLAVAGLGALWGWAFVQWALLICQAHWLLAQNLVRGHLN